MKHIAAFITALAFFTGGVNLCFAKDVPTEINVEIPYTKNTPVSSDFGMDTLYTDDTFTETAKNTEVKYGDRVYASNGGEKYIINPVITYVSDVDKQGFYFDFDGNLETDTEKGLYNKINIEGDCGELKFLNDGTVDITPQTEVKAKENYTSSAKYVFEQPFSLKGNKHWQIRMRYTNRSKIGLILSAKDLWSLKSNSVGIYENRPNFISNKRLDVMKSEYTTIWNSADVLIENKENEDGEYRTYLDVSSDGGNTWKGQIMYYDAAVPYWEKDTDIVYAFSWPAGTNAFNGIFDYLYIIPSVGFNEAMNFIQSYDELLSGVTENPSSALIGEAVDAYENLSNDAKSELTRGEYEVLMKLGKKLASGDCTVSEFCGEKLNAESGDGTAQNPYRARVDVDYKKTEISAADVVLADRWADAEVNTKLNGFINEVPLTVKSGENTAHYIVTVFPLKENSISDANAAAFISARKDLFRKTEVTASDKRIIEETLNEFLNLPESAKAELNRGEKEFLENLYLSVILESINEADTPEKMIAASQNELGIYTINECMAKYLINVKPTGGFADIASLDRAYKSASIVNDINEKKEIVTVINDNADLLKENGIDIKADYELLSDGEKAKLAEILNADDFFKGKTVARTFRESIIMAEVKYADSSLSLKNAVLGTDSSGKVINNNFELIGADKAKYNALSTPEKVFNHMFPKVSGIVKFEDIAVVFNNACTSAKDAEKSDNLKKPTGGGSGGGGNTSSGKGGAALAGGALPVPEQNNNTEKNNSGINFSDIENHWGKRYILSLAEKGIISGYDDNTFRPDKPVIRAEFVKLVLNALNITGSSDKKFNDVSENDWYFEYISRAVGAGIITGSDDNNVYPEREISREDAAVIIYRNIKDKVNFPNKTFSFKDGEEISDYCIEAVNDMAYAGIISGKGSNKFYPGDTMTRAEAAALISNTIDYIQEEK